MQEWIGKALVSVVIFVQSLMGVTPPPEAQPTTIEINQRATTTAPTPTSPSSQAPGAAQKNTSADVQTPPNEKPVSKPQAVRGKPTCTMLYNGASYSNQPGQLKTVKTGDTLTLSWKSTGGEKAYWLIESGDGVGETAPFEGSKTFTISVNESGTWYRSLLIRNSFGDAICRFHALLEKGLNANSSEGQRTAGADLSVPPPTCLLKSDKMTAKSGDTITISWESTNADYATDPGETGNKPAQGSRVYTNVTYSRSYGLTFFGKGGKAACVIVVPVDGFVKNGAG